MKKFLILLCAIIFLCFGEDMIVRVYVRSWKDLNRISKKPQDLDIAAGRYGEWYDLVVDREGLNEVIASGVPYEVTVYSLEYEKEKVRGTYLSYTEINDSLRNFATNYPSICKFDSLPNTTYEGRWIYGVKISDNGYLEEDDEPGFTIDGCHHSREWATPQAVLFFADSMLSSYGEVSEITEIVNTTEIYCFPLINVDGYVYDYPDMELWRKNREPFGGYTGTDPNRNYGGACNGEVDGYWGAADEDQVSHHPSSQTFCGAYAFCGDEIWAYTTYIREHEISTGFSLHSYGEQIMYPWGYKGAGTPDSTLYDAKGNHMARLMECLPVGTGTYTSGQSYYNPYPSGGNTRDWVYGYNKWVAGLSTLFYGAEIGDDFYEPQGNLDHISRQVFKAALYLAGFADSLILVTEGFVPPPKIYPLGTVGPDFTIYWHAKNIDHNNPTQWELVELSDLSTIEDDLESGIDRWILEGFTLSTSQAHSGTHSLFSGNIDEMNHAVRTAHPYLTQPGDSLTFWCWYNLETNCDVAMVEASENTKEWFCVDTARFNGNSGGWIQKAYSLDDWIGKSIYIRFRAMTDGAPLGSEFYVDDVYPVCLFENVDTISSSISDTLYLFIAHPEGQYYYFVRGYNTAHGWGDYSCLETTTVVTGIAESPTYDLKPTTLVLSVSPNPFEQITDIRYQIPVDSRQKSVASIKIYNSVGQLIKQFNQLTNHQSLINQVTWYGDDDAGRRVSAGIYFVQLKAGDYNQVQKVVLLR
ncbi:MAG: immune inhibitor A [candidate division WOR-3 bacterium]|nr:MAG: immune inhibitor A [candidate division WOR-3 bacterium]